MAFVILENSTTCDATDINNNFYEVAQGSRLPLASTTMVPVDAVNNLGSSTYTWNNLHCVDINVSGTITTANKSLWYLMNQTTLAATASSIEFTGLNGDVDVEYKLIGFAPAGVTITRMIINGDSATNYGRQSIFAVDTVVSAGRAQASYIFFMGEGAGHQLTSSAFGFLTLHAKTGLPRTGFGTQMMQLSTGTYIYNLVQNSFVWNNTTSTITSLKIYALSGYSDYLYPGTKIELWKRS